MRWLTSWHTASLDVVMIWASIIGERAGLWVALALLAMSVPRYRAAGWRVFLTVSLAALVNNAMLKPLIGRARLDPDATAVMRALPEAPTTFSFPSGHAATTFGGVVAVCRMWPQGRVAWWVAALMIAFSRIYLGHHYPSDVIAGALVGILTAFWVLGGRHRATYDRTLPQPMAASVIVRP